MMKGRGFRAAAFFMRIFTQRPNKNGGPEKEPPFAYSNPVKD